MSDKEWTRSRFTMHVRLDPWQMRHIRNKAKLEGKPLSEIVRTYVEWGMEAEQKDARS